ncbi:MAG: tryptophan--tRNA ligase [Syntrophales bacterium]|nr:tryptophan--tRNA ligase [Syntrophales bacterium]MCK9528094.1 tryptophan--tRNA ligase [Syntrophales bacterium]MDX9922310.1 tryptophan--tRNA ligase [Syntrophales bacterium]
MKIKRIVSGMRPTGKLHLGNFHGALHNWVNLQNRQNHECFYFVADWHALTSDYKDTSEINGFTIDMVIDWLSAGLDPAGSTLFLQSGVKEHAELFLILSMITPLAWLERNPTYKEMREELTDRDLSTAGFLSYPVLQAADIIMYKADGVPVGVDQLPHIELTREIARRFNFLFREVFTVPDPLLTDVPRLLGLDGRKMSKSYNNSIYLRDRGRDLSGKVLSMFTDPERKTKRDPGRPHLCNVFAFHGMYSAPEEVYQISEDCKKAVIGCVECKERLAKAIAEGMASIHETQDYYLKNIDEVRDILAQGTSRARSIARTTMDETRDALKLYRIDGM